jgi:polyisoprenyl-teichoic acid--peptidoglycan teichoic acid transferase
MTTKATVTASQISSGSPRRGRPAPAWRVGILLTIFALATGLLAFLVFTSVRDFVAGWRITELPGPNLVVDARPVATAAPEAPRQISPPATVASTPAPLLLRKWAGTERVTVLLMGIDYRAGATCETQGSAFRTDSMMLATVDPVAMTAGLLSIPRDLWVTIPGFENNTINTANFSGDVHQYPGGGPALAVKTVEYNFGVKVDDYVRMDFSAFENIIDATGGVDINNQAEINDSQYPDGACGFEPFYLTAGPHHLNGHDALRYARTRHNSTDIARGERQQEVALAVLKRISDPAEWPAGVSRAPGLYQALNADVKTNLTLDQILALGLLVKDIPADKIRHEVIGFKYVQLAQTPDGRQVLIPRRDNIRGLRDSLFASAALQPHTTAQGSAPASP